MSRHIHVHVPGSPWHSANANASRTEFENLERPTHRYSPFWNPTLVPHGLSCFVQCLFLDRVSADAVTQWLAKYASEQNGVAEIARDPSQ
jgi:hypothetical protein